MKTGCNFRMLYRWLFLSVLLGGFLLGGNQAQAQPNLNFKRISNNWPTIELYFSVTCEGQPAYIFNKDQHFKIFENGVEVADFTLWCPDPKERCAISVALVFDASGSMGGAGNQGAIAAGLAFVELMDGINDEAAIIYFSDNVVTAQAMTNDKFSLQAAVAALPVLGMTAAWDGIFVGIQELVASGTNPCRAVIAMTDGYNNASTFADVPGIIALAQRNRIHVFTIGLGTGINAADLETIALMTGGKYYQTPNADQLAQIYVDISTIVRRGFDECLITYQAKCMDGTLRTVDLSLLDFCNGSDTKTKTYRAPQDTGTYTPLEIKLGKVKGKGLSEVRLPLELVTPINPKEFIHPATFTVLFDPNCVSFKTMEALPGSLLDTVPWIVTPVPGGVQIQTKAKTPVEGSGLLAELIFELADKNDTTCCEVKFGKWEFTAGCFKPVLKPGEICIIPRQPLVKCSPPQMPNGLVWIRAAKDYEPNPFQVQMVVYNEGDKPATGAQFKIVYDKKDFQLVQPLGDMQRGDPVVVRETETSQAQWLVKAKRRLTGDSVSICITASFDNHPDVTCCAKIWIPPTEPVLECTIADVHIEADNVNQRYNPMPFDIVVTVRNDGGMKTEDVFATISFPPDLALAGTDAPDKFTKKVTPAVLQPQGQGGVKWSLRHPITIVQQEYVVEVWVKTANADSSRCEVKVVIPPLDAPALKSTCDVPAGLVFDDVAGKYNPNPFTVKIKAVNQGAMPAENVTAFLYLPANVELVDPNEPLRKTFNPSTLPQYKVGDPIPELSWLLRYTKKLRYNTVLTFKWAIGGVGMTGIPTDSVESYCEVPVPGLPPSFDCDVIAPDSLVLNATETDVEPNPFQWTCRVWNTSKQTAAISKMSVYYPPEGINLTAASQPQAVVFNPPHVLAPGETLSLTWEFKVLNRITRRDVEIWAMPIDDEGNPVYDDPSNLLPCRKRLPIAALPTALTCSAATSEPIVRYVLTQKEYDPTSWTITASLTNTGGFELTNVFGEMIVDDQSGLNLVEFDPTYPDNTNPKTLPILFPGSTRDLTWGFRLKNLNTSDVSQFVRFTVTHGSKETPTIADACDAFVEIEPVITPSIICALKGPDTLRFVDNKYEPDLFDVQLRVENIGTGIAENVQAYVLQDTRFNIDPPSFRTLGSIPAGNAIDYGDNDGFRMRVNPRAMGGYDTLRVVVVANGIARAMCELPIWVEAEKRPTFEMNCTANPDVLTFDDVLNDYVPNPFEIVTRVKNIGTALAKECEIRFIGPAEFTPYNSSPIQPVGAAPDHVMLVGDSAVVKWQLTALRRDVGGWTNIVYQIQGKGGLGDRQIIAECSIPVYVPPARNAEYSLTCTVPERIAFDRSSGVYLPDPFPVTVEVENTGLAEGIDLEAAITYDTRLTLAQNQNPPEIATKPLPNLKVGEKTTVTWLLSPVLDTLEEVPNICVTVRDRFNKSAKCCKPVIVEKATNASLELRCSSDVTELEVDAQRGDYKTNPFTVRLTIKNIGARPVDDVYATLQSASNDLAVVSANPLFVASRLDIGQPSVELTWQMRAIPRTQGGPIELCFYVTATGLPQQKCCISVIVPAIGRPSLDCHLITIPADRLEFDETTGDYAPSEFIVRADVMNVGDAQANGVIVTLLPPNGVMLLDRADTAVGNIDVNGLSHPSWRVKPIRQAEDAVRKFTAMVTAQNATDARCETSIEIEGAPKMVNVMLPKDAVGRFGEKIIVPVTVSPTISSEIRSYKLTLQFDPSVVKFIDVSSIAALTAYGWIGPRATILGPGIVRIEDVTTGAPLASKDEGVLVYVLFESVFGKGADHLGYSVSPLKLLDVTTIGGKVYVSSFNSYDDAEEGDVQDVLFDGVVTVSGECLLPLNSSLKYELTQNRPNPFNPTTQIAYTIADDDVAVKLTVHDALGRIVRTLVDQRQKAGRYSVTFDAGDLASGTYYYRLETPVYSNMLPMVLAR